MAKNATTGLDAIEKAMKACNTGNAHRSMQAVVKRHWTALEDDRKQREFWEAQWRAAAQQMRHKFLTEFKSPQWKTMNIEWSGKGYVVDYTTVTTKPYMHYRVFWGGMHFEREFAPKTMSDVVFEARALRAILMERGEWSAAK